MVKYKKLATFFNRNRSIAYSGSYIFTELFIPERIGLTTTIINGKIIGINYKRGIVNDKYMGNLLTVEGDTFRFLLDDTPYTYKEIKHALTLCASGDDYKIFLGENNDVFNVEVILIEPGEIICVPNSEEYFLSFPNNLYQKITLKNGLYKVADEYEEYIGYYVGKSNIYNLICIKIRND